jgi:hypothetical protein
VNVSVSPACLIDNINYSDNYEPCGNKSVFEVNFLLISSLLLVFEIFFAPINTGAGIE